MKYFLTATVTTILTLLLWLPVAAAEPIGEVVDQPPVLKQNPFMVTAYAVEESRPLFIQIYNTDDSVVDVTSWEVSVLAHNDESEVEVVLANLSQWVRPRGHMVLSEDGGVTGADITYSFDDETLLMLAEMHSVAVRIMPPTEAGIEEYELPLTIRTPLWAKRNISSATGNYLSTFSSHDTFASLVGGGLYIPPDDVAGLEIVEIHANAADCAPFDASVICNDYIKLHNPTDTAIDLGLYRLRSNSGGIASTSSNTFSLEGLLLPGEYFVVSKRTAIDTISLTNSGGYVWIEDLHGVMDYDASLPYPDSQKGMSWAKNGSTWDWMEPAPEGANYWPPPIEEVVQPVEPPTTLADCGPGRERNPATNRCRSVVTASSTLGSCPAGQERNPETNRCRSTASTATVFAPCNPGQERNPATNRCRSIVAATTTLTPCAEGQERNPETNRCRKVTEPSVLSSITEVQDVEAKSSGTSSSWYITAAIVAAAVGYAIYEWRREIGSKLSPLLRRRDKSS